MKGIILQQHKYFAMTCEGGITKVENHSQLITPKPTLTRVGASYSGSFLKQNDVFFPWVPFIKMHMVIKVSLDLLIGTWILINNSIMKRIV
jgi:hypothetical protein